jgi:hypothetical protein
LALAPAVGEGNWMVCPACTTVSIVQRTPVGRLEWRRPTPREWFGRLAYDPRVHVAIARVRQEQLEWIRRRQ